MLPMAERWLVVAHEATNSGAPRMLLRLLQEVRARRGGEWSCEIVTRGGGPLLAEFREFGPVHVLSHPWAEGRSILAGLLRTGLDRPWGQRRRFRQILPRLERQRFDLVYNNTGTNGELLPALKALRCPILTHVHELAEFLRGFCRSSDLDHTFGLSDAFVAVSRAVAEDIVARDVARERVTIVPNFVSTLPEPACDRDRVRRSLGLPVDADIVVGCGHLHAIKGTDLFLELVALAGATQRRPLCAVWIGGDSDRRFAKRVRHRAAQRGLHNLRFHGPVHDADPWLVASDLVAVTSRLESFSLVALQAAALARPVIGFAGARGLKSVLRDFPGLLVPGYDVAALTAIARDLLDCPEKAQATGLRLRRTVEAEFLAGPHVEAILAVTDELRRGRRH